MAELTMFTYVLIALLVLVVCRAVWLSTHHRRTKNSPSPIVAPSPVRPSAHDAHRWPSIGEFVFEVVGESNYQAAISKLAGQHDAYGANKFCSAELILEDGNPHDPKAVAVRIDGNLVGYFSRDDARSFRRRLSQKRLSGMTTICDAIIVGGGEKKGAGKLHYGVRLDIKPFGY